LIHFLKSFGFLLVYCVVSVILIFIFDNVFPKHNVEISLVTSIIPIGILAYYFREARYILFSIISANLIFLSFPDLDFFYLIYFAFIPLFILVKQDLTYKSLFLYGMAAGIVNSVGGFYWLNHTIIDFGHLSGYASTPIFILFTIAFSLKFPVIVIGLRLVEKHIKINRLITFPIVITLADFLIPELFPWYFGNSQHTNFYFIQIAEITSVVGITYLIGFINTLFYEIYLTAKTKTKLPIKGITVGIILIVGVYIFGFIRVSQIKDMQKTAQTINVGIIQPNTPMTYKRKSREQIFQTINTLSHQVLNEAKQKSLKLDLLVWPESSASFSYSHPYLGMYSRKYLTLINSLARDNDLYVFFGDLDLERNRNKIDFFNTASLVGPDLKPPYETGNKYHKIYLLAFGEYIPLGPFGEWFPSLKSAFKKVFKEVGDHTKGDSIKVFNFPKAKLAPQICYEIIIPSFTRQFIKEGGELIINITNDIWFGITKASKQHLIIASFRAIENRVPIVRSTNSGISTFIDPLGDIVTRETPLDRTDTLIHTVRPLKITSVYTFMGDVFSYILIGTMFFIIFFRKKLADIKLLMR